MDLTLPAGPIVVGNHAHVGQYPADALMDELRIVDHPLFADAKTIPVPTNELSDTVVGEAYAAGGPATAHRPERRRVFSYRVATPPTIDGRLDDACWQRLPAASGFTTNDSHHRLVPEQTDVQVCHDGTTLYLGITCHEDALDRLRAQAAGPGRDGRVFGDDAVEVFLSGNAASGLPYVQIGVNSKNVGYDQACAQPGRGEERPRSTWRSATSKQAGALCVELAIPFAEVPGAAKPPPVGDAWRWNVCRDRYVGGLQYSSLSFVVCGFHSPSEFGDLLFAGEPATPRVAEEARWNPAYLEHVQGEVTRLADEVKRELDLARSVSDEDVRRAGLDALLGEVRQAASTLAAFAGGQQEHTVTEWSAELLACKRRRAQLEEFAYRLAGLGPTGPLQPPADLPAGLTKRGEHWFLASPQLVAAVSARTGAIAGLWERPATRRLVTASYDLYHVETRSAERRSDERLDQVTREEAKGEELVLDCTNPDLPGVALRKTYRLQAIGREPRGLARELHVTGSPTEPTLLTVTSNTLFDAAFRKDAWYDRLKVIGTAGDPRSVIPAAEITAPLVQRGWFNSSEGRAQFALMHPALRLGLGQYLLKEKGRWTFPQALGQSTWTPFGWQMGSGGTFVTEKPYTAETRYHLFRGDRLTFHQEYWTLPEYAALRREWTPHPAMPRIRSAGAGFMLMNILGWDQPGPRGYVEAIAGTWSKLARPNEILVSMSGPQDNRWGTFPAGDDAEFLEYDPANTRVVSRVKAPDVRRAFALLHQHFPQYRMGLYTFIMDISSHSPAFQQHPEWLLRGRDGQPVAGYYGPGYWLANWRPEFVEHLLRSLLQQVDYLGEDFLYLDFGVGVLLADWGRGQVVGFDVYLDFLKRLQAELARRGKFLWLNASTGGPFYDLGYWEGAAQPQVPWRATADELLLRKVYTPPGAPSVPIYWLGGDQFAREGRRNEQRYANLVLGLGFPVTGCWLDPYAEHFPAPGGGCEWASVVRYQAALGAATVEYYNAEWVDIGLEPAWWRNLETPYEAYTLKLGDAYFLNVISHRQETADAAFTVDPARMGFDAQRRTFLWQHSVRDPNTFPKKVPLAENWDRMFSRVACRSVPPGADQKRVVLSQCRPDLVEVTVLTQVPAVFLAVAGVPTQTRSPAVLDCRIGGRVDEAARRSVLRVEASDSAEVAAWWPEAWGVPSVTARGGAGEPVRPGARPVGALRGASGWGERFVRFELPKGAWFVELSGPPAAPAR
jgi:hypothetical protein